MAATLALTFSALALKAEIADPIDMQDYRPSDGHYVLGGLATR
jgi:hypothetical protein